MGKQLEKVVVTITDPNAIAILLKLKKGVSKKFAVETALEKLYEDKENHEILFASEGKVEKVAPQAEAETPKEEPKEAKEEEENVIRFNF